MCGLEYTRETGSGGTTIERFMVPLARHGWRSRIIDLSIVRHASGMGAAPHPPHKSESSHLSLAFINLGLSSNDEGRRHPDMSQPLIGTSSCLIGIIRISAAQMNLINSSPLILSRQQSIVAARRRRSLWQKEQGQKGGDKQ